MPQPPKKLTPKIILEGTRLTHKTDLAFALNEHPRLVGPRRYRYHSPVISAEWCAFTNSPWGRGPINFAPEEEGRAMETYATWARLFELMPYYSWIVDRFHLSTQVVQASLGRHYDFRWLEERLLPLRFAVVSCWRSPGSFEKAREERLKISGNPGQYDDLGLFIREQEAFTAALQASLLPQMNVDVSDGDIPRICDEIADWMEERDLLGMP